MTATVDNSSIRRAAWPAAVVLVGLTGVGTAGYWFLEGWSVFDSLYMTIVTLSTVGYGETHTLSRAGRAFTLALIAGGVGNIAYAFGVMTQFFAAGGWGAYRRRARMMRELESMQGHTIVCGYGRLGSAIVRNLRENRARVVVIERSAQVCQAAGARGDLAFVHGDAESDEVLQQAGIGRARALVAALDDDASNVFLCLTARVLNPHLVIYGKADDPATLGKLERAGANHQFSPSQVAGHRVAWQILRPAVTDLIGIATVGDKTELAIEEVRAGDVSGLHGVALSETRLWGADGVMVLAIKTREAVLFPPDAHHRLEAEDRVVVMGKLESLARVGVGTGA